MGNICWIASYPKSGNTWMRAFIENYLQNQARPVDINTLFMRSIAEAKASWYQPYVDQGKSTTDLSPEEICAIRPLAQADIARQAQATVFVKSHNFLGEFGGYPLHNSGVTSGAVYMVRNPLDVAVSLASYFTYSIDEAIDSMAQEMTGTPNEPENVLQIISSWSTNVESWTKKPEDSILVLRYEDLLDQPQKAFKKVVAFLGQKRDPARLKKAVMFSSFEQMKAQESRSGFVEKFENTNRFFRRGRKDQWRQQLTESQVRKIIDRHGAQMERFRYIPRI